MRAIFSLVIVAFVAGASATFPFLSGQSPMPVQVPGIFYPQNGQQQQNPSYNQNYPQYDPRDPPRELPYGQDGLIMVRNNGLYTTRFFVDYTLLGRKVRKESEPYIIGSSKSIVIPNQAEDITVTCQAQTFLSGYSAIFVEEFKYPVRRCYKVSGTTLGQSYEPTGC